MSDTNGAAAPAPASATPAPAASAAPSASPATTPTSTTPPETPSGDINSMSPEELFTGFSSDDEGLVEVVAEPEKPVVAATPEVKPAQTPAAPAPVTPPVVAAPAPAPQVPAEAPKAPVAAPQQPPVAESAAPISPPSSPQELAEQMSLHREGLIDAIAQQRFQLSKEEADALDLDPVKAVPRLLARVHAESVSATLQHIQSFVPRMIAQTMRNLKVQEENEGGFYRQFPSLDKAKHHKDVVMFGNAFRTSNPGISQNDLWAMIGAATMAKHGLAAGAAPVVNGAPAPGTPQPVITPIPPFVPAQSGASVVNTENLEESPFAGLGRDFEE